jgi:hypothetical protein
MTFLRLKIVTKVALTFLSTWLNLRPLTSLLLEHFLQETWNYKLLLCLVTRNVFSQRPGSHPFEMIKKGRAPSVYNSEHRWPDHIVTSELNVLQNLPICSLQHLKILLSFVSEELSSVSLSYFNSLSLPYCSYFE